MQLRNLLASLALAGSFITTGCLVSGEAHVRAPVMVMEVDTVPEPPPPVYEAQVTVVRPGFVWIGGHYNWNGSAWVWAGGHYERERVGYVWAPGQWQVQGRRRVWVEGRWNASASGGVEVRDHRAPPPPPSGPIVRDHRHD